MSQHDPPVVPTQNCRVFSLDAKNSELHYTKRERVKKRLILIALTVLCPLLVLARAVRTYNTNTLVTNAELVFIGRVNSITPSGITTTMSYPMWQGATFEWLNVEAEVLEPVKGVQRGQLVSTAMLSVDRGIGNAPSISKADQHTSCDERRNPSPVGDMEGSQRVAVGRPQGVWERDEFN